VVIAGFLHPDFRARNSLHCEIGRAAFTHAVFDRVRQETFDL